MGDTVRVIIAGGRDFRKYYLFERTVRRHLGDLDEIVSGGARGADAMGERYAEVMGLKLTKFPADWERHGKSAGYLRNVEMAVYADILVAFWDGESRGTKHMIDIALARGLEVHVYPYTT